MSSGPIVELQDVGWFARSTPSKPVVANVNLQVFQREIVGLCGPSGSGKSTLLKIIAGLWPPTAGEVRYSGNGRALPRFSYLDQSPVLLPWLTVEENVADIAHIEFPQEQVRPQVSKALERFRLTRFANQSVWTLSGGMAARAALARVMIAPTPLALLDEPFSHLDEILRRELLTELVQATRSDGTALLIVSHEIDELAGVADRICVIAGTPSTVVGVAAGTRMAGKARALMRATPDE